MFTYVKFSRLLEEFPYPHVKEAMPVTDVRMGTKTIRNGIVALATHVGSITSSELIKVNNTIHLSISELCNYLENHD